MTSSRLAKVVLAIVGVWGLLSGLMLIHTLLATKQLNKRVTGITTLLTEIDQDSLSVGLMRETDRLTGELLAASQPLPGTLDAMGGVTAGLAGKLDSILAGTGTIERNSAEIHGKVAVARDTADAINGSAKAVGHNLADILATLRATQTAAAEINASTRGINAVVADLLPVTKRIDTGIATANEGIVEALGYLALLRSDISNILLAVPDVQKHAASIDCHSGFSALFGTPLPGEGCRP